MHFKSAIRPSLDWSKSISGRHFHSGFLNCGIRKWAARRAKALMGYLHTLSLSFSLHAARSLESVESLGSVVPSLSAVDFAAAAFQTRNNCHLQRSSMRSNWLSQTTYSLNIYGTHGDPSWDKSIPDILSKMGPNIISNCKPPSFSTGRRRRQCLQPQETLLPRFAKLVFQPHICRWSGSASRACPQGRNLGKRIMTDKLLWRFVRGQRRTCWRVKYYYVIRKHCRI